MLRFQISHLSQRHANVPSSVVAALSVAETVQTEEARASV